MSELKGSQNGIEVARELVALMGQHQRADERISSGSTSSGSNNGPKVVAGLVGTLAVIVVTGLAAYTGLCNTTLDERIKRADLTIERHTEQGGHSSLIAQAAQLSEKFAEVETQFRGLREVMNIQINELRNQSVKNKDQDLWVRGMIASQLERINALERQVYIKDAG